MRDITGPWMIRQSEANLIATIKRGMARDGIGASLLILPMVIDGLRADDI